MVTVEDILTYEGSNLDTGLNYTALILSIIPSIFLFHHLPLDKQTWRKYLWIPVFIGLSIFQVALCLIVLCSGVSVIWSALDGFNLYLYVNWQRGKRLFKPQADNILTYTLAIAWIYSIILWIYYTVTADALTTIAHLCALVLGIVVGKLLNVTAFRELVLISREENQNLLAEKSQLQS